MGEVCRCCRCCIIFIPRRVRRGSYDVCGVVIIGDVGDDRCCAVVIDRATSTVIPSAYPRAMSSEGTPSPSPVVLYDIERSSAPNSSPDIPGILRAKRHSVFPRPRLHLPRPLTVALTCLSIAASALQANGVYCWGTYGPVVATIRQLDATQAQTIVVG